MFKFIKDFKNLKESVNNLKELLGYSNDSMGRLYGINVWSKQLGVIDELKEEIEFLHKYLNVEKVERIIKRGKAVHATIKLEKIKK